MYISSFYGIVPTSNNKFKIFYPVYSNGDINPAGFSSDYSTFSGAVTAVESGYHDLQNALANSQNISLYGMFNILFEQDHYLINQVILEINSGQSSDPDYTNILTSINTNLTNLNTNIQNKNNQSDIVDCLNNIFCYPDSNNNLNLSCIKDNTIASSDVAKIKSNMTLSTLIYMLVKMLNSNSSMTRQNIPDEPINRTLDNISKKLSLDLPSQENIPGAASIRRILVAVLGTLTTNTSNFQNCLDYSNFKMLSEKLANSNDLHTISQAIDLISTAIAQTNNTLTNTNTDLGNIATNINSIQSNPLIEVNIDVPYEVKNLTKKDTEY